MIHELVFEGSTHTNMKSHQLNVYHYSNHLGKKSPLNDFVSKWVHAMSFQTDICDGL